MTVYYNNEVEITIERADGYESRVNINGDNLIWINSADAMDFKAELQALLNKYRI